MSAIIASFQRLINNSGIPMNDLLDIHRVKFKKGSMFFSIDVETNGPNHDLLCGGIVAYDHIGKEVDSYRFSTIPK